MLLTNPHWAHVVGYGPFSLCVIHKEGLCPSSGDINRLMMMMMLSIETHAHLKVNMFGGKGLFSKKS
jgi:hypothetical protein